MILAMIEISLVQTLESEACKSSLLKAEASDFRTELRAAEGNLFQTLLARDNLLHGQPS